MLSYKICLIMVAGPESVTRKYWVAKYQINKLEQAILAKALQDELTAQDPDDEPAGILLERILAKKEKVEEGKNKKRI
jgi:hypothetical protein